MTTNVPLHYSKAELLDLLRGLLPAAEKADAKALARHRKDEEAALKQFRAALRDAIKWDYETAKKNYFSPRTRGSGPSCPKSQVSVIKNLIAQVERSNQKRFTLSASGYMSDAYYLVMRDVPTVKGLC